MRQKVSRKIDVYLFCNILYRFKWCTIKYAKKRFRKVDQAYCNHNLQIHRIYYYIRQNPDTMELRLDIGIKQLIGLIKQLPLDQKLKIKKEVDKDLMVNKEEENRDNLTELLLAGPTMTEAEEARFKKFNDEFAKWTKSLSA